MFSNCCLRKIKKKNNSGVKGLTSHLIGLKRCVNKTKRILFAILKVEFNYFSYIITEIKYVYYLL